jgi:predicted HTH domain antitoxin
LRPSREIKRLHAKNARGGCEKYATGNKLDLNRLFKRFYEGRTIYRKTNEISLSLDKLNVMRTIILKIPDTVDLDDREAKMLLASRLYEKGKLSLGQAAEITGLSKRAFMEILGDYDVSVFNLSPEELDSDIKNAENYSI